MYRSTRRDEARNTARGTLPPENLPSRDNGPTPPPMTEALQGHDKRTRSVKIPERRTRPMKSSTNIGVSEGADVNSKLARAETFRAPSQRKAGRSPTPGPPDENEDWIEHQHAPALPIAPVRAHARSRTTSGGSRSRVKSEENASRLPSTQGIKNKPVTPVQYDQETNKAARRNDADRLNSRTRSSSTSQDRTKPIKRKISWGKTRNDCEEPSPQELNNKSASQLGLPGLEKELVPSLRDTIHKMTGDQQTSNETVRSSPRLEGSPYQRTLPSPTFSSTLSPPTRYERTASPLSLRSTSPIPMESTPTKSRYQVPSPRAETHRVHDDHDAFDRAPDVRPKYPRVPNTESNKDAHERTTKMSETSEAKPKSILKSSLKTPRNMYQNMSPKLDTDDSASEPALLTPRIRSSSRSQGSPIFPVSASPGKSPSNIPSPGTRFHSSPAMRSEKLPVLSQSNGQRSPLMPHGARSPILPSEIGSRSPGSANHSAHFVSRTKLRMPPSRSPIAHSEADDSQTSEGTPKASRVAWNTDHSSPTESNCSSDEREHIGIRQSLNRLPSCSTSTAPSPKLRYNGGRVDRQVPVASVLQESSSDTSGPEVLQCDKAFEDSHVRRKNELVNLVAGLNLDFGSHKEKRGPTLSTKAEPYPNTERNRFRSEFLPEQSAGRLGFDDSRQLTKEHDRTSGSHPRRSSSLRRLSATPHSEAMDQTIDANKVNGLLKPDWGNVNRDSLLMLNSDHQREAFGIPPSVSDTLEGSQLLSATESNTSIRNPVLGSEYEGEASDSLGLSCGAEKLFSTLGIGAGAHHGDNQPGRRNRTSWRSSMAEAEKYLAESMCTAPPITMSTSSSSSSIYEDDVPDRPWQKRERDLDRVQSISGNSIKSSWKKTLANSAYLSLLDRYGESEMRRQEVIWELCETEQAFLKSLRTVLKVFVHPLIGKNRTWVSGLPSNVSRLLDWLEDIFQLHAQISSALQRARSTQYPVVMRIAETLRSFVPRLEVYQPYVVRLDEVVDEIEGMMKDHRNELGEFFRIQSTSEECAGMAFCSFLWLPLTRLGRYLKHFSELWVLTPRSHVDHLPTFSLLHSATMVVRVMREVKLREEEYTYVKELVSRIQGLPGTVQLMRRERRLIAHGVLHRVYLSDRSRDMLENNAPAVAKSYAPKLRERQHHLIAQRRRANSLDSCLSDGASMTSLSSAASNSSFNGESTLRYDLKGKTGFREPAVHHGTRFSRKRDGLHESPRSTQIYAFIFNDLALFTTPIPRHTGDKNNQGGLELMEDIGICRVLSVVDHSGNLGYDHLIGLHVLPMDIEQLDAGIHSDASATSLFIHLPHTQSSGPNHSTARRRWWSAFEKCYHHTLRSLSFPEHTGKYLAHGPALDQEDNTRQTVMSILASGLPLPKSPSVQIGELGKTSMVDAVTKEREERGWWTLRFQQTLREMQRDDFALPSMQRTSSLPTSSAGRKTMSSRRLLRLGAERK